jgi:hypothetical protein
VKELGDKLILIPAEAFNIFAMSLPEGPNFGENRVISTWASPAGLGFGAVLFQPARKFTIVVLRRREDYVFETAEYADLASRKDAVHQLYLKLTENGARLPIPPGVRRRTPIHKTTKQKYSELYSRLSGTVTYRGAFNIIAELYLALPKPDDNFISDLEGYGFNARIWELYLFACFKEQGCKVSQDFPSPDFEISIGIMKAFVEAVTTNPTGPGSLELQQPQHAPADKLERVSGDMAARFAKTLRSKLQKKYAEQAHVKGYPFALAIADFSGGATMLWSREALIAYLYGEAAQLVETSEGKKAVPKELGQLIGHPKITAGLFKDPDMAGLSAVIFSNAGTLPKFQRMATQAGMPPDVVTARRIGELADFSPEALESIPFDMDTRSEEYKELCGGKEFWCFEMEVFHNPTAALPFAHELLPGARHWFDKGGEIWCTSIFRNQILKSVTKFEFHDPEASNGTE